MQPPAIPRGIPDGVSTVAMDLLHGVLRACGRSSGMSLLDGADCAEEVLLACMQAGILKPFVDVITSQVEVRIWNGEQYVSTDDPSGPEYDDIVCWLQRIGRSVQDV